MSANYDNRIFRSVANTPNGEVGGETRFHYRQRGDLVWASYEGGGIAHGHLIATVGPTARSTCATTIARRPAY